MNILVNEALDSLFVVFGCLLTLLFLDYVYEVSQSTELTFMFLLASPFLIVFTLVACHFVLFLLNTLIDLLKSAIAWKR